MCKEFEELKKMHDFWKNCMYLNDWDTSVDLLPNGDFAIKAETSNAEGENTIYETLGISDIIIKNDSELDREFILVHELAHLITFKFLTMVDEWSEFFPQIMYSLLQKNLGNRNEATVNHIAKALIAVRNAAYDQGYQDAMNEIGLNTGADNNETS